MLDIGQRIFLTPEDWSFTLKSEKNEAQRRGLALDIHIKRLATQAGMIVSQETYGPWDWGMDENNLIDTKSTSSGSISVSSNEAWFTERHQSSGGTMLHAVFTQDEDCGFTFQGFVNYKDLTDRSKLYPSRKDAGGYYYVLKHVKALLC